MPRLWIGEVDRAVLADIAERFNAPVERHYEGYTVGAFPDTLILTEGNAEQFQADYNAMVRDLQTLLSAFGCKPDPVAQAERIAAAAAQTDTLAHNGE